MSEGKFDRYDTVQHGTISPLSAQIFIQRRVDPDGPYVLYSDVAAYVEAAGKLQKAGKKLDTNRWIDPGISGDGYAVNVEDLHDLQDALAALSRVVEGEER